MKHQVSVSSAPAMGWRLLFALVWLANGLFAKVLDRVPRHGQIVGEILGPEYARELTILIGLGEIGIAAWILTGIRPKLCAGVQIGLILCMNLIERLLVRDLLLFGSWNLVFALLFCILLWAVYFVWPRNT